MQRTDLRPLIAHVVYSFHVGGLENGVINLINRMDGKRWRHAVIALATMSDVFCRRLERGDVQLIALRKGPGHLHRHYPRLVRLFQQLQPAVVHTRNLAALEAVVPAAIAGVPVRIHGEHGWDVHDIDGIRERFKWVRRLYRPFVHRYVALSRQIESYLVDKAGFRSSAIEQIYNGVDTQRFSPRSVMLPPSPELPFRVGEHWVVGTVGRMQPVKDQMTLVDAFVGAAKSDSEARRRMRLAIIGDGPMREIAQGRLQESGLAHLTWLPGERSDVPSMLRCLDLFVLPSLSEGISNTILEAMATALPVIATPVGGNAELVEDELTGRLVPVGDVERLTDEILAYFHDSGRTQSHGSAGRARVEAQFSLEAMVRAYEGLYTRLLDERGVMPASLSEA